MSADEKVHVLDCGCREDEATGLPIEKCFTHDMEHLEQTIAEFSTRYDRLLVAAKAVIAVRGLQRFPAGLLEDGELIAAVEACEPPAQERETDEVYPLSRGDA